MEGAFQLNFADSYMAYETRGRQESVDIYGSAMLKARSKIHAFLRSRSLVSSMCLGQAREARQLAAIHAHLGASRVGRHLRPRGHLREPRAKQVSLPGQSHKG